MASREERMQQRLRGAQRRQVKDVDFGLILPSIAPVPSLEPASRSSPQPDTITETSLPSQTAIRRSPRRISGEGLETPGQALGRNDANISAKRRKLDTNTAPSSQRSTKSSQRTERLDIYDIPADEPAADVLFAERSTIVTEESLTSQLMPAPEVSVTPRRGARTPRVRTPKVVDEVSESPANAPGSGQRTRAAVSSVIKSSSYLQRIQTGTADDVDELETPMPLQKRKRGERAPKSVSPDLSVRKARSTKKVVQDADEFDELSPEQPVPRETRGETDELDEVSPEQPTRRPRRVKPTVEDLDELTPEQPIRRSRTSRSRIEVPTPGVDESSVNEPEEAEAIDDDQAAALLEKNRGQRRISRSSRPASPDLDEQPVIRKRKRQTKVDASPVRKRKSKSKLVKKSKNSETHLGRPIPITVHRLTNQLIYDEEDPDADILNAEVPHAKRGGVNAVDVLSQICQEIIGSALETLETGGNNCEDRGLRREYLTKWRAVESFGSELQSRFLEHTINLDNAYSLERRLKDEHKEKLALREDILKIRAEREQIALKMDEIRIKHEDEKDKADSRNALNTVVHDIELAVELGKNSETEGEEMIGTELLLKRVAGEASTTGGSGGLLRQIKDFNAFLQRAAEALETRKV